ncbi:hypothetical protein C8Q74DRAFT_1215616 [Fomes fomentarius]|nr:hypothetical protein C8Q74DRAFT_1215616 [Fomes fomentarius]
MNSFAPGCASSVDGARSLGYGYEMERGGMLVEDQWGGSRAPNYIYAPRYPDCTSNSVGTSSQELVSQHVTDNSPPQHSWNPHLAYPLRVSASHHAPRLTAPGANALGLVFVPPLATSVPALSDDATRALSPGCAAQPHASEYSPALSSTSLASSSTSSSSFTVSNRRKARSSTSRATSRTPAKASRPSSRAWTSCSQCGQTFTRRQDCERHRSSIHESPGPKYVCCGVPIEAAIARGVPWEEIAAMNIRVYRGMIMVGGCWDPAAATGRSVKNGKFARKDSYDRHLKQGKCLGDSSVRYFSDML